MGRAREIEIKVIPSRIGNDFIKKHHYSGKVVNNSVLHFGCFLDGRLHGVLQYGNSLDKRKMMALESNPTCKRKELGGQVITTSRAGVSISASMLNLPTARF